jgi:2-amino-4-hydroxy-6-hydroxymethyldihydropteridine diphosphokinase
MTRYAIGLGSNIGDRAGHLQAAVAEIESLGEMRRVSGLYETAAVGGPEQDPYLNAVVVVESQLSPEDLLDRLHSFESAHDRRRDVRWGPRTLDLDIIATDGDPVSTDKLQIPHPRAAERRFVLDPLRSIWPEAMIGGGITAEEASHRVADQEVELLLSDWSDLAAPRQGRYWVGAQLVLLLAIGLAIVVDGSLPGSDRIVARGAGVVLLILGMVAALAAARALGRALTPMPAPLPEASLVESGIYARARHPIYGGVVLVMLGASLLFASLPAMLLSLALIVFFWAKSGYEERRLRVAYPGYRAYRSRVRRRMIPFLI